jgi:hypothetical protein
MGCLCCSIWILESGSGPLEEIVEELSSLLASDDAEVMADMVERFDEHQLRLRLSEDS